MKKYLSIVFTACVLLVLANATKAQKPPAPQIKRDTTGKPGTRLLSVLGEQQGDSIVLRWSPADASVWLAGQTYGYVVKRYTIDTINKKLGNETTLTDAPVMPWSIDKFKAVFEKTNDTLLAAAAEILYNKTTALPSTKNVGPAALMDKANQQNDMRLYGQLIACFSPACAKGMGLSFTDKTAQKGKEYFYQVYVTANNIVKKADTGYTTVALNGSDPKITMKPITAKALDRIVQFYWNKSNYGSKFVAYLIERSDDGGKTFRQYRRLPVLEMSGEKELNLTAKQSMIRDSLPKNYFPYQFRIRGINAFGDRSAPSNVVTVSGLSLVAPPPAAITQAKNFKSNLVKIDWKLTKPCPALAGYLIGRGLNYEGPFAPLGLDLIKPNITSFIDSTASSDDDNYYIITALDTAGNFSNSMPGHVVMKDTIPPDAPIIAGTIDTAGRVTITWQRPKAHDVAGYIVQRANALNHDFIPVSKGFVVDTTFMDSIPLKTLTKHIFYRVLAYDKVRNGSAPSNLTDIAKPDIVPPVPAVFTNYLTTDSSIQLTWNVSSSTDLSKQYLYRKTASGDWQKVAQLNNTQASYIDTAVRKLTQYTYQLISEDSAGLKSAPSFPITAKTYFKTPTQTAQISAELQADSSVIKIKFTTSTQNPGNTATILLYRSVNGVAMIMYANIPAGQQSYIDKHVAAGNTYSYCFRYKYSTGGEGMLSSTVSVDVKRGVARL